MHYHVGEGYSLPILRGLISTPEFIFRMPVRGRGITFEVYVAWKGNFAGLRRGDFDIMVFNLGIHRSYLQNMTRCQMALAKRAIRA